jgi:hypothetical protein
VVQCGHRDAKGQSRFLVKVQRACSMMSSHRRMTVSKTTYSCLPERDGSLANPPRGYVRTALRDFRLGFGPVSCGEPEQDALKG